MSDVIPPGLRFRLSGMQGYDTLCLPAGQIRELIAEYDRRGEALKEALDHIAQQDQILREQGGELRDAENEARWCHEPLHFGTGRMWRDRAEKSVCISEDVPDGQLVHVPMGAEHNELVRGSKAESSKRPSTNNRPHEIDCLFWGALESLAKTEKEAEKKLCGSSYANGQGDHFRSGKGMKLGQILRRDPDPYWQFTDKAAFEAYVRTEHPGVVETRFEVSGTDAQVVSVLMKHAPELLREVESVPDEVFTDALSHSRDTGEAAGPGIEFIQPAGALVVNPDRAAVAFLRSTMQTQLDTLYPKALEAADDERKAS